MKLMTEREFEKLLNTHEGMNLEFKSARTQFSRQKDLPNYCSALSNEGGGKLILGVSDSRKVVGTGAFKPNYNTLSNELLDNLGIRVDVEELYYKDKRTLLFHVPEHYSGRPVKSNGAYWMRAGESLKHMDEHTLKRKLNETEPDFTERPVPKLKVSDLDKTAINIFRELISKKTDRKDYIA
ncbi:helix-turn-helix domain-containing protein [Thermoproteota archaeon]